MTLQPGDMIATGTPKGLSDVVPGDEVIVEVEGVGRLVNRIISQQAYGEAVMKKLTIGSTAKTSPARSISIPPTRPPAKCWRKSPPAAKPK
jgi:hypothetical protein